MGKKKIQTYTLEELTDKYVTEVDEVIAAKEKEVMTV